jgi:hypothetical protein
MRKGFRILKWVVLGTLAVVLLAGLSFAFYLEHSIGRVMSREKQKYLINEINSSPPLPERFYKVTDKYMPGMFRQDMWGSVFEQVFFDEQNHCQCREIYFHPGYTDHQVRFYQAIIAFEIEDHCSNKKCFEYNMAISDFGQGKKGIQAAAKGYFGKDIGELTEEETLTLILVQKAPAFYRSGGKNSTEAVQRIMKSGNYR